MDLLRFYHVGKDGRSDIPNGSEVSLSDLLDSQEARKLYDFPIHRHEIGNIHKLTDLKSSVWRKVLKCIFAAHGINISENIKEFERIHFDLRKKIIDTNKPMLSFIDRPEFIFWAYPYFLLAFSFRAGHQGFDGTNGIDALYAVLERMYSTSSREIETYFCAHRENKEIKQNSLREIPNFDGLSRILNLIFGIFENIWDSNNARVRVHFKQPWGDSLGIQNVFPNIFFRHLHEWTIGEILSRLDLHIEAMNNFLSTVDNRNGKYDFLTSSLKVEYEEVELFLENLFQKGFLWVTEADILSCENPFISTVKEKTLHDVDRIISMHQGHSVWIDIEWLIGLNLSNAVAVREYQNIDRSIRAYIQGFNSIRKALYETALYRNWGKHIAGIEWGIALWFERDHAEYQTTAFKLGFQSSDAPIIYGRHSDARLVDGGLNNIGLRQFWYY